MGQQLMEWGSECNLERDEVTEMFTYCIEATESEPKLYS